MPVNPASGALVGVIVREACSDCAADRSGARVSRLVSPFGGRFDVAAGAAMVCSIERGDVSDRSQPYGTRFARQRDA
jgi:hypothetical protein